MEVSDNSWERGLALDQAGRTDEAIAEWREGLHHSPTDVNIHFSLAYALRDKGQHLEALAHFRESARLRPDYYTIWFMLAKALVAQLKQHSPEALMHEVRDACRHALTLNPVEIPEDVIVQQRAYLFMHLGKIEYQCGNKNEGIRLMQSAINLHPHSDMFRHLMSMYTFSGRLREAHKTALEYHNFKSQSQQSA